MHPRPLPAAVGGHDRSDAGLDRGLVRREVERPQRRLVTRGVGVVDAVGGAAVAQIVLGVGENGEWAAALLEPVDVRGAHERGELDRLAERLVGAAPPLVARHGDDRRERKVCADPRRLLGDGARHLFDQRRVARGAEADVVREHGRAVDGARAVHDVEAVDDRDLEAARKRCLAEAVNHVGPASRGVLRRRRAALAVDGTDAEVGDVGGGDVGAFDLVKLGDLFVQPSSLP